MSGAKSQHAREELEVVYIAYGMIEAEVVKGRLEASGIPAVLNAGSNTLPFTMPNMGEVRVLVPSEQVAEARQLLGEDSSEDAPDEAGQDETPAM